MAEKKSLLVIDDEESICFAFEQFFKKRGWSVTVASSAQDGLRAFAAGKQDVVFLDIRLPDRSGLDVIDDLRSIDDGASVIMITAYGDLENMVRATRSKAFDFLVKPIDLDQALHVATVALDHRKLADAAPRVQKYYAESQRLVGNSTTMQEIYKQIARMAHSDAPVLITGQTGTGKELAARSIHQFSVRNDAPFVAVNCGALPDNLVESELFGHVAGAFTGAESDRIGRFEAANGGTIFLDEIGELPPSSQVKLLRVLDCQQIERIGSSKPITLDVRVMAATNRELAQETSAGRFRNDLYYRLAVMRLHMPSLMERADDIIPLAEHFLHTLSDASPRLSPAAAEMLQRHQWHGNVRELRNAIQHAAAMAAGQVISPADLPENVRVGVSPGSADEQRFARTMLDYLLALPENPQGRFETLVARIEDVAIKYALDRFGGNRSQAAEFLGLHRNTLRNKLRGDSKADEQ